MRGYGIFVKTKIQRLRRGVYGLSYDIAGKEYEGTALFLDGSYRIYGIRGDAFVSYERCAHGSVRQNKEAAVWDYVSAVCSGSNCVFLFCAA